MKNVRNLNDNTIVAPPVFIAVRFLVLGEEIETRGCTGQLIVGVFPDQRSEIVIVSVWGDVHIMEEIEEWEEDDE